MEQSEISRSGRPVRTDRRAFGACAALFVLLAIGGCKSIQPLDTKPLDGAGMTYDTIAQLKAMKITAPEVAEMATARQSGFSDADCIAVMTAYRGRGQAFDGGDEVAGLMRASVGEQTIVELAKMNQLGLLSGELEAMHLAGLSDAILLEVARHRAANEPVLSGASLANLKNAGVRELTLLELVRRGVPESQGPAILKYRKHGASDAEIVRHYAPVQGSGL